VTESLSALEGKLRTRVVLPLILPFLWFSTPTEVSLLIGGMLTVTGLAIRAWAAGTVRKNRELAIVGPYAFVRNPLYLGALSVGLGVALAGGHWVWLACFLLYYWRVYGMTIADEETHLERIFGERYERYRTHVPAILPRLVPYRDADPNGGFRVEQYFRNREWNVLLVMIALFAFLAGKVIFGFADRMVA